MENATQTILPEPQALLASSLKGISFMCDICGVRTATRVFHRRGVCCDECLGAASAIRQGLDEASQAEDYAPQHLVELRDQRLATFTATQNERERRTHAIIAAHGANGIIAARMAAELDQLSDKELSAEYAKLTR
jgi:hypothetical protein